MSGDGQTEVTSMGAYEIARQGDEYIIRDNPSDPLYAGTCSAIHGTLCASQGETIEIVIGDMYTRLGDALAHNAWARAQQFAADLWVALHFYLMQCANGR